MRILVTGMSGLIGGLVGRALAKDCEVRALNRRAVEGVETVRADIRDADAVAAACEGVHTAIHFTYEHGEPHRQIDVNIKGAWNLFEAAKAAGVRRVIYASSGATQAAYEREEPVLSMVEARYADVADPPPVLNAADPVRPVHIYGVVKTCIEAMGRMFVETGELSVLCARLGRVRPDDRPHNAREAAVYLSHGDVIRFFEHCVRAPLSLRYGIYYAVSDNRTRFRDLEPARRDLGFVPQDGIAGWPPEA